MQSSYKWIWHVGVTGCLLLNLALVIRSVMLVVNVEGQSMYPALQDGDKILVFQRSGSGNRPDWFDWFIRRGQITIVSPWFNVSRNYIPPKTRQLFVKRIIGIGDDTIVTSITELNHKLRAEHIAAHDDAGNRTWHVPYKHVFVRSDNLPRGHDSLTWGPIPYGAVRGIMIMKLSSQYKASAS